ncbi:N-acetylmuramoyl-L-alanine amidase AmiB [Pseudidiomarina piscicola]|uniref:N-acetylmuramoyl-L-alanine amidase n=1 Tax=Pseudidiomarina piscicola TaxID=2614830 RepID=A0A6S6WKP7_9GAMM|nr:N-acetylmuramoyl-L-alanine amidase [Pseudidiomarina piscicola]CAB0150610.1 N-acetylmuramoyl-L-alanine amidase AmiB [Pseudidiomarina piscicola]VZT40112.1 N-acetylmuramoyl-L-alanine amidase AmiB [Pseudomonas aeruginosa]
MQRLIAGLITLALVCFAVPAAAKNTIENIRMWPSPDRTRVVFDMSQEPDFSYFQLNQSHPFRLVIDLPATELTFNLEGFETNSLLVKKIRTSTPKTSGSTRLVVELDQVVEPKINVVGPSGDRGHRLVVDLPGTSVKRDATALSADDLQERKVTVAIDAGHGGEDPGSVGPRGTYEKDVVLRVARALANMINADPTMQAYLIRSDDYYVDLNERPRKAERVNADLFVSIHADAFVTPQPRGASIWVLSNRRASTEMGRLLENKERLSDVLAGVEPAVNDKAFLNQTLVSMKMDHAMLSGYEAATEVLSELKRITKMHKTKPQHASLAVLTSTAMPSMLVETGFISNPTEEQLLLSNQHQQKLARAIYQGVRSYFMRRPPDGTLFATNRASRHVVKSGESLSILANRYNTSVSAIKARNKLDSSVIRIGQVLEIPTPE